jgi:hypothetical protein
MQALVELLLKVDSCHETLEPKITEVVAVIPVVANLIVISKTRLELSAGSDTVFNVAFPE